MDEIELINKKLDALFDVVMDDRERMRAGFHILGESADAFWEMKNNYDDRQYSENQIRQLMNQVTYLHNRVNDIEKMLGMDGSVPTKVGRGTNKYLYK